MKAPLVVALLALAGHDGLAQGVPTRVAEEARHAWLEHAVDRLLASSSQVLIQLPGTDPSAPVSRSQAAALLQDYLGRFEEVAVEVRTTREGERGTLYVELGRRYRVPGTQEVRNQTLFLSYQHMGGAWVLTELRISG